MNLFTFDTYLKEVEYISPEEYLLRREQGEIHPDEVEIVAPNDILPWGGFKVKLKEPKYEVNFSGSF